MSLKAMVDRYANSKFAADGPFPSHISTGGGRVLVLAGANASGKSLVFRSIAQVGRDLKLSPITLSIRERSGGGSFEMGGFRRSMIYGEEAEQSTGAVSVSVIQRGFGNVISRLEKDQTKSLLMLDEPEMGLSEGYCRALGRYLAQQVEALPEDAPGLVVVSHSRALIQALVDGLSEKPHFIHMGKEPTNLDQWLSTSEDRSIDELMNLVELGGNGRREFDRWVRARDELKNPKKLHEGRRAQAPVPAKNKPVAKKPGRKR